MLESKPEKVEAHKHADPDDDRVVMVSSQYVDEAKTARFDRLQMNRKNMDCYHLRQDWSHKKTGQSKEFLAKQPMAVEQITQFFQQGLIDMEDWFRVEYQPGVNPQAVSIRKEDIQKLADRQLSKAKFFTHVGDMVKNGLLTTLMITKIHGKKVKKPFYEEKTEVIEGREGTKIESKLYRGEKSVWELALTLINFEDFYQDPSGKDLYWMHEVYLDYHEVKALSEGEDAIYDPAILALVPKNTSPDYEHQLDEQRRTGKTEPFSNFRKKIKLQEFWGTCIHPDTGEVMYENCVWTIANDRFLIQRPSKNPFWHGKRPFVVNPIVRVPNSTLHRALMDAPTAHNIAINELFNLMLDSGMMATYGIKQYRPDWMEDDSEVAEGFYAGQSVAVNSSCPPNGKVLERVDTAEMNEESMHMLNLTNAEFQASALTNDLRMGVLPNRQVKATEVVEASQTITSVFSGMAKVIEIGIEEVVEMAWMTTLQHMNDLSSPEVQALIGADQALKINAMTPAQRFSDAVESSAFRVFGITRNLTKQRDFRKVSTFLQAISASPLLLQEFTRKYNMGKLMEEIMRDLDINVERLQLSPEEMAEAQQRYQEAMQMQMQLNGQGGNPAGQGGPGGQQSAPNQKAMPLTAQSGSQTVESRIPQNQYPPQAKG